MSPINHNSNNETAILLIHCPDRKGLVLAVTEFIHKNDGNITYLDQHVDSQNKKFFMRIEWELDGFIIPKAKIGEFFETMIALKYEMEWNLHFSGSVPKMAVFVSQMPHCLYDLVSRCDSGEWRCKIPVIISNHDTLRPVAEKFGISFYHLPVTPDNKTEQEQKQLQILKQHDVDFIVLARYMQIVTGEFIQEYHNRIINIHHSFLPAFPGARPYHSAYKRGVKIIGSTSHYVTDELDAGPIIEQDVVRVTHADSVNDIIRKGRDLEKVVLSRAVWKHIQHKVLVYDNRTVIFT